MQQSYSISVTDAEGKSKSETFIARLARIYTPVVVFAAVAGQKAVVR